MEDEWRKEQKLQWFTERPLEKIEFENINPDKNNNWINLTDNDFETFISLYDKETKSGKSENSIFNDYSVLFRSFIFKCIIGQFIFFDLNLLLYVYEVYLEPFYILYYKFVH